MYVLFNEWKNVCVDPRAWDDRALLSADERFEFILYVIVRIALPKISYNYIKF